MQQIVLKNLIPETGLETVRVMDLVLRKASDEDFMKAQVEFEMGLRGKVNAQQWLHLRGHIEEEGWSAERLERTAKYLVKNLKFIDRWTVADWFNVPSSRLYSYDWMLGEVSKDDSAQSRMVGYKINDVTMWKYADNIELPFEKIFDRGKNLNNGSNTESI